MNQQEILRLEAVGFSYPDSPTCFNALSHTINKGDFLLLKGPSGGGKSTMLRLIARFEEPCSGMLYFNGKPAIEYAPQEYRRQVCLVQQTPTLISGTVRENLLLPFSFAANQSVPQPSDSVLREKLQGLLLGGVSLDTAAKTLSVGQKQRLCLVRSMLLEPQVLLMDEPTSALDPESRTIVEEATEELCRQGVTVLWVSHNEFEPNEVSFSVLHVGGGEGV